MPDSVCSTGKEILLGCRCLERVSFSSSLERIEVGLISRCRKLKEIHLPKNIKVVCNGAFAECCSVEHFQYDNPDIVMGVKVFDGCTALLNNSSFVEKMDRYLNNSIGQK